MATDTNTPRKSDLTLPRSFAAARCADSFMAVMASAKSGSDRNVANDVTVRTAQISSGETNLGTNHNPAATLTASPQRNARKRSKECLKNGDFISA